MRQTKLPRVLVVRPWLRLNAEHLESAHEADNACSEIAAEE